MYYMYGFSEVLSCITVLRADTPIPPFTMREGDEDVEEVLAMWQGRGRET